MNNFEAQNKQLEAKIADLSASVICRDAEIERLRKANAELLEVLESIVEGTRLDDLGNRDDDGLRFNYPHANYRARVAQARAAIAKARGES